MHVYEYKRVCESVCLCVRNMVYVHVSVCERVNMCVSVCAWGCERV